MSRAEQLISKLTSAISRETILFPIIVRSEEAFAELAGPLISAKNIGIPRTYVSFQIPKKEGKRASTTWKLRAILEPLNGHFSVVSAKKGRLLTCVSFSKPTLESTVISPLEGG